MEQARKDREKKANTMMAAGVGQIAGGSLLAIIISIIYWVLSVASSILPALSVGPALMYIGLITGGLLFIRGIINFKTASGLRKVSRTIGDNPYVSFINLERRLFWNRRKLLKTLSRQMKKGYWPKAHIDMTDELFVQDYDPVFVKPESGDETADGQIKEANEMIHKMVTIGRTVEDKELKAEIDRLVEIANQIYTHVKEYPDKASLVRRLSNYFLPTTIGLLGKYTDLQKQSVRTDNMTQAMQKIKDVMKTLEAVYKNQLDALYSENAMNVDVEIEVLQSMAGV